METWQKDYWKAIERMRKALEKGRGVRLTLEELQAFDIAGLMDNLT